MAISPQRLTIYLYSSRRAVIFAIAQLSCAYQDYRRAKMHQNSWSPGLRPGLHWDSLQRSLLSSSWWVGGLPQYCTSQELNSPSQPIGIRAHLAPQCWFRSDATVDRRIEKHIFCDFVYSL